MKKFDERDSFVYVTYCKLKSLNWAFQRFLRSLPPKYLFLITWESRVIWRNESAVKKEHLFLLRNTKVQFLAPAWWLTTIQNSNSRRSKDLPWPCRPPGMHLLQKHTFWQNTHTRNIVKIQNCLKNKNRQYAQRPFYLVVRAGLTNCCKVGGWYRPCRSQLRARLVGFGLFLLDSYQWLHNRGRQHQVRLPHLVVQKLGPYALFFRECHLTSLSVLSI